MWIADRASARADSELARLVSLAAARDDFFDPQRPLFVARAPARLDVMGGIADYSGSLVLELPLSAATWVAAQATDEPTITVTSAAGAELGGESVVSLPVSALTPAGAPLDYGEARALLRRDRARSWMAYVVGALVVLQHAHGRALPG